MHAANSNFSVIMYTVPADRLAQIYVKHECLQCKPFRVHTKLEEIWSNLHPGITIYGQQQIDKQT